MKATMKFIVYSFNELCVFSHMPPEPVYSEVSSTYRHSPENVHRITA